MEATKISNIEDNWQVLRSFLPADWQDKAKELGALRRCRKFANPETLLRVLMIHLAEGCSLRETAVRASHGGLVGISDVALLKRLRSSGEWLRWMAAELMQQWLEKRPSVLSGTPLRIRIIDGTCVQEPGSTGSSWKVHYSICLPSLLCDEFHVTTPRKGETFKRFKVEKNDIMLADRGYAHRAGIGHVVANGGHVLVRINLTNVPLIGQDGESFPLLENLRTLQGTQPGDWQVFTRNEARLITGRVCALRKSKQSTERAQRKIKREYRRVNIKPETLEAAGYIIVFTTLDESFDSQWVLEMYRGRWQVEIAFKRLKSIMGLGHLKKTDIDAAKAWIHGKLFVSFLIEALIAGGESFFPWGYPLCQGFETLPVSMA